MFNPKTLILVLLVLLICGCQQEVPAVIEEEQPTEEAVSKAYPYTFSHNHFGLIESGMSAEQIASAYGAENFVYDTLYGPEGITYPGYRLYPGTDAEAEITFPENEDSGTTGISIDVFKQGSPWRELDSGIGIGTSLKELVRLNGKKINFYGFGWDYGGLVSNLNDGNLTDDYRFILHLDYGTVAEEDAAALSGDQEIDSDFPQIEGADISVRAIFLEL